MTRNALPASGAQHTEPGSRIRQHLLKARQLQKEVDRLEWSAGDNPQTADLEKIAALRNTLQQHQTQAAELRSQARGLRGATFTVQAGGAFTIPFVADVGAYLGGQLSGPDTGNPTLDGFAKTSLGTTLGLSAGYALGRERSGLYSGAGILNVGYQSGNPITGKSISVRWPGLGSLSLNQRGYGVSLHLPIGFYFPGGFKLLAAASVDLEHPALERLNRPVFQGIDYAIERARHDMEIVRRCLPGFASRRFTSNGEASRSATAPPGRPFKAELRFARVSSAIL